MTTPTSSNLPPQDVSRLIALFNAGRHAELEREARLLTQRHPGAGFAWKVLGTALLVQGKDGVEALAQAVALTPADVETWSNLGNAQKARGLLEDAATSHREAVRLKPDHAFGHYNLGTVLMESGQAEAAVESFRRAIELLPGFIDAHYNLGLAWQASGRLEEAARAFQQAVALVPEHADAHYNLGVVLQTQGRLDEAARCFRRTTSLRPDHAQAHCNLGVVLQLQERPGEALPSLQRATACQPGFAEAHLNLGNVLKDLGRYEEALRAYQQAVSLRPDFADAHNNLGSLFKDLGRFDEAQAAYRDALRIVPDYLDALGNLLFTANYMPAQDPAALLALARQYGELAERQAQAWAADAPAPTPDQGGSSIARPLRVGLVSGDLRAHPVGHFLDAVVRAWRAQSADRVALFAYATAPHEDALTRRLRACCQAWHNVAHLDDAKLAELIRRDGIDILIDLSGHTAHNRLPVFAGRAAPVQVTWLGYFATTGVPAMDWFIADPWTAPAEFDSQFTERIWRLPETRLCFTPPDVDLPVEPLPALANGHVTFGCFNNLTKVNDEVVHLWSRVLAHVPGSRLLLKSSQLDDATVRRDLMSRFAAQGVDTDRLLLQGKSSREAYLAAYAQIDIALDPFPFTGGTTTVEGLWMGVPALTLAGDRLIARQGVGLMVNAGLPEWVAEDADDYVMRAGHHAADIQALSELRAGLRQQVSGSPLFDAPRFASHLQDALEAMWQLAGTQA
jgi:protein O-GlcNAc transferase